MSTINTSNIVNNIIELAIHSNFVVFGGYVRDICILNKPYFKDIDFIYFDSNNLVDFLNGLSILGINYYEIKNVKIIKNIPCYYGGSMRRVIRVKTLIIRNKKYFKDPISIDLVKIYGSLNIWKQIHDCDFSCNLFIKDFNGVSLRYIPDFLKSFNKEYSERYIKELMEKKEFFIVMDNIEKPYQLLRLIYRAMYMIKKDWKMKNSDSMFLIEESKQEDECPICLDVLDDGEQILTLKCRHKYCVNCFISLIKKNLNRPNNLKCPKCRCTLFKKTKYNGPN